MSEPTENNPFNPERFRIRINEDLSRWLSSIKTQKAAQAVAGNYVTQEINATASPQVSVQITQNKSTEGSNPVGGQPSATSSVAAGGGGTGLPEGAIFKEFQICEDGEPKTYWFVVWEEEPIIEEEGEP